MNDLVSIIMPSFNQEDYISYSIESIINQTYKNWELLITDDGSTDSTISIIKKYINIDSRIKLFILEKNNGASYARNISIKHSNGRYISFCDSDDLWVFNKLEEQLKFMILNNYYFTFTSYDLIDDKSHFIKKFSIPSKVTYIDLLKTCSIGCLTVIYDTKYLGKFFFTDISKRQDYVLWLSILKIIPFAYGLNNSLAKYRTHSNSLSSNKLYASMYQWKVYREIENLNLNKSLYFFIMYAFNGVLKYIK